MNFVDSTGQFRTVDRRDSVYNEKITWSATFFQLNVERVKIMEGVDQVL